MVEVEVPAIFRTVETPGRAVPEVPSFDPFGLRPTGNSFSEWFSNLFKAPKVDETLSAQGKSTQTLTPKPGQIPSGNQILTAGTVIGGGTLLAYTATNPGFQSTSKEVSANLASLGKSGAQLFSPLFAGLGSVTSSPLGPVVILGVIALGVILLLKK